MAKTEMCGYGNCQENGGPVVVTWMNKGTISDRKRYCSSIHATLALARSNDVMNLLRELADAQGVVPDRCKDWTHRARRLLPEGA